MAALEDQHEPAPQRASDGKISNSDTEAKAASYTDRDQDQTSSRNVVLGGLEEKALVRKLDLHIIPVVMVLYLLSFLDR